MGAIIRTHSGNSGKKTVLHRTKVIPAIEQYLLPLPAIKTEAAGILINPSATCRTEPQRAQSKKRHKYPIETAFQPGRFLTHRRFSTKITVRGYWSARQTGVCRFFFSLPLTKNNYVALGANRAGGSGLINLAADAVVGVEFSRLSPARLLAISMQAYGKPWCFRGGLAE